MRSLSADDVRTRLPELLARAEKGESFEITESGRAVARLVPVADRSRAEAAAAAERLRAKLARGPRVSEQESEASWARLTEAIEAGGREDRPVALVVDASVAFGCSRNKRLR